MKQQFLTSEETAELLRLPVTAVWRLCRQQKLPTVPGVRPYRIIRTQLMKGVANENSSKN